MSAVQRRTKPGPTSTAVMDRSYRVGALAACFLFFLIRLRTVSDGWAPRASQCSMRSRLERAVVPLFFRVVSADELKKFFHRADCVYRSRPLYSKGG